MRRPARLNTGQRWLSLVRNYTAEYNAMHQLYENPDEVSLAQWGIDYVLFDSYGFSNIQNADESWYADVYKRQTLPCPATVMTALPFCSAWPTCGRKPACRLCPA